MIEASVVEWRELHQEQVEALADLLIAVVQDGASVGFLPPLSHEAAFRYFAEVLEEGVRLWAALIGERVVGTVQLQLALKANGSHRAEIAKLMVHPDSRGQGLGRRLMRAAEQAAREEGRTLLCLDTREGDPSNRLYRSLGYVEAGRIPRYARSAEGTLTGTVLYYKELIADDDTLLRLSRLESAERREQLPPERLLDLLGVDPEDTVLDLGAGGGYLTLPVARRTQAPIYAVDAEEAMREVLSHRSKESGLSHIQVLDGLAEAIPLADASVDKGIAALLFHILEDPACGVKELLRVLKRGGLGLIVEWAGPRPDGLPGHRLFQPELSELLQSEEAVLLDSRSWGEAYYSVLFRKA